MLAGRGFSATDFKLSASNSGATPTSAPTPVIVNQAFVEKYLGKENPLGKRFGESAAGPDGPASPGYEIIGVVRDARYNSLRREIHAMMYMPQSFGGSTFELRTAAIRDHSSTIREAVSKVNTNCALDVKTESEQINGYDWAAGRPSIQLLCFRTGSACVDCTDCFRTSFATREWSQPSG